MVYDRRGCCRTLCTNHQPCSHRTIISSCHSPRHFCRSCRRGHPGFDTGVQGLRRAGPGRLHCSPGERGNSPGEHVERSPRRPSRPTHPLHTSDTRWPNQDSRLQNPDQRVSAWSPSTWPVGSCDCGPVKNVRPN